MLDRLTINPNLNNPENLHIAKYEGIIVNAICSQGFLFGNNMDKIRRTKYPQPCFYCGGIAVHKFKNGKYCCEKIVSKCPAKKDELKKKAGKYHPLYKERIIVFCNYCGKIKEISSWEYNCSKNHFCNKKCCGKWKSENLVGENSHRYKQITVFCDYCGKSKTIPPCRQYKKYHFCNLKCMSKWQIKQPKEKHNNWQGGQIIVNCTWCNKPKKIRPCLEHRGNHFCNQKCMGEWRSENLSDMNHYNWQGGISAEPYCGIWLDKDYRQSIEDRDNNECQNPDCWKTPSKLIGHHIDYDKKNCHPWNVITICVSCNSRANYKREYWQKLYQNIMTEKYGYQY